MARIEGKKKDLIMAARPSFMKRAWPVLLTLVGMFGGYTVVLWRLGKLSEFLDHLDALAGVFVALFTLVLVWIEHGRDLRDDIRQEEHRSRIDRRVSAVAFLISRQLRSWLSEIATLGAGQGNLIETIAILGEIDDDAYKRTSDPLFKWWGQKTKDQDEAERRFEGVVAILPEASPGVAEAVRHAFVKFADFAGRWNQSLAVQVQGEVPDWKQIVRGLKSLQSASDRLDAAIDAELRQIRDEAITVESPIEQLAEALSKLPSIGDLPAKDGESQQLSAGHES